MVTFHTIQAELEQLATPERAMSMQRYFKTQKGDYGAGDQFLGVSVPNQRLVAKQYQSDSDESTIQDCLNSPIHELRLTGVFILVVKYKGDKRKNNHEKWVNLYLKNSHRMNNWDLVDSSAHLILGDWLEGKDKQILYTLAESDLLWNNRIAIISTLHFIRKNEVNDMLLLVEKLLHHPHDLMHKANGWMLREGWQRKPEAIEAFLEKFGTTMPRTTLRYAIEKMSPSQRKYFMDLKKESK